MKQLPIFSVLVVCLLTSVATAIIIDDFSTTQMVLDGVSNCVVGSDMIGGERDTLGRFYSNSVKTDINTTNSGQLYHKSIKGHYSHFFLAYDGLDGSYSNHNYGGLGHQDLTEGGAFNGFIFDFTQTPSPSVNINIWMTVRQGSDNEGYASTSFSGNPQAFFIAFDEFSTEPPAGSPPINSSKSPILLQMSAGSSSLIDFVDVGYIQIEMSIWDGDDTFALNSITTGQVVPEPVTLALMGFGGLVLVRKRQ